MRTCVISDVFAKLLLPFVFFGVEFASCTHGQIHFATGSSHENKFIYTFFLK